MTVIAGMWENGGSILVGADSLVLEDVGSLVLCSKILNKLKHHDDEPFFVWGTAGNKTLGDFFSEEVAGYDWRKHALDWVAFRECIASKAARFNAEQRRLIELSGSKPLPEDCMMVLVAAFVQNAPRLFSISDRAVMGVTEYPYALERSRTGFTAIGSGAYHAMSFFVDRTKGTRRENNPRTFREVLEFTADRSLHCGGPIHIYRISRSGIEAIPKNKDKRKPSS